MITNLWAAGGRGGHKEVKGFICDGAQELDLSKHYFNSL